MFFDEETKDEQFEDEFIYENEDQHGVAPAMENVFNQKNKNWFFFLTFMFYYIFFIDFYIKLKYKYSH